MRPLTVEGRTSVGGVSKQSSPKNGQMKHKKPQDEELRHSYRSRRRFERVDDREKKYVQNFDAEMSCKTATWKTEKTWRRSWNSFVRGTAQDHVEWMVLNFRFR
jgi:hypothetical protein